ncbi:hypothetical protein O3P69_001282 [Scylla paramamosain]|uniref:Uncharacterized protein n=1 Tax=Scylla paramamosain TaxID=85552 RepID=A0AAW0UUT7_SCYPA
MALPIQNIRFVARVLEKRLGKASLGSECVAVYERKDVPRHPCRQCACAAASGPGGFLSPCNAGLQCHGSVVSALGKVTASVKRCTVSV